MARSLATAALSLAALRAFVLIAADGWPFATGSPPGRSGPASADATLEAILLWTGAALTAWLAAGALVTTLSLAPGALGRLGTAMAPRVTPALVRQLLVVGIGAGLGALSLPSCATAATGSRAAAAAQLDPGYHPTHAGSVPTTRQAPDPSHEGDPSPGWRPARPTPSHDAATGSVLAPPPRHREAVLDTVTVRRGDTLWGIAADHLGPSASVGAIAHEWPRWYAVNRAVIGEDPDLIRPGTQLRPPPDRSSS